MTASSDLIFHILGAVLRQDEPVPGTNLWGASDPGPGSGTQGKRQGTGCRHGAHFRTCQLQSTQPVHG